MTDDPDPSSDFCFIRFLVSCEPNVLHLKLIWTAVRSCCQTAALPGHRRVLRYSSHPTGGGRFVLNSPSSGPPNRIAPCAVDWVRHKRPSSASNHSDSTGRQNPTVLVHLGWRSSSLFGECCGGFVTSLRTRLAVQQWDLTLQSRLLHPVKPLFSDMHLCHTIPGSKHGLKTAEVSLEGFHHNPTAR